MIIKSPFEVFEFVQLMIVELRKQGIDLRLSIDGLLAIRLKLEQGWEQVLVTDRRLDGDKVLSAIVNEYTEDRIRYGLTGTVSMLDIAAWLGTVDIEHITSPKSEED